MRSLRTWWIFWCIALLSAAVTTADSGPGSMRSTGNWLRDAMDHISTDRMLSDIAALSGPGLRGRQTGSAQDKESATFVANRFASLRLHPLPAPPPHDPAPQREWVQTAPVTVRTIKDDPQIRLKLMQDHPPLKPGAEFLPILDSPSVNVHAPIVFVGYGLSDPDRGHDDYAQIEVKGKIVLFLRGKPDKFTGPAAHADKERTAKEKGAVAYLTATGPILSAYEMRRGITGKPSALYAGSSQASRLPGAWINTHIAESIVQNGVEGTGRLRQLQEHLNRTGNSKSFLTEVTASMKWDTEASDGIFYNVVSILRGSPAQADADEAVIIGAHRDHFGRQAGLLFPGADDNASGSAVLLEVARLLSEAPAAPKRSILFLSFSGEELGLLGSRLYVSQPSVPLTNTIAMINVDHAGIGNGRLTVGVTGLEKNIPMEAGQSAGVADTLDLFGFFPGGDHVPFKEAGVPTITVVSGGIHSHFHQPTDTVDTIDPDILRNTARYVLALVWQLANQP